MDRTDIITLMDVTYTQDANGIWMGTPTERDVFCQVDSVTASEYFEGGRNGLNPEYRFRIFYGDYNGERLLRFHGKTYAVYRTFIGRSDTLELYAEREGGVNGKKGES